MIYMLAVVICEKIRDSLQLEPHSDVSRRSRALKSDLDFSLQKQHVHIFFAFLQIYVEVWYCQWLLSYGIKHPLAQLIFFLNPKGLFINQYLLLSYRYPYLIKKDPYYKKNSPNNGHRRMMLIYTSRCSAKKYCKKQIYLPTESGEMIYFMSMWSLE